MNTLETVWDYREETLYPRLFGSISRGIFALSAELFASTFGQLDIDPRWLHLGVIEFAPTAQRNSWLYVTSGGSTPWETEPADYDPEEYSWLGVEFVMETEGEAPWAIEALARILAYQVLVCHGRLGDLNPLDHGDRLPVGGPLDGSESCQLRFLAIGKATHYPASAQLPSGKFDFLHVVGITSSERDFARSSSTEELLHALAAEDAWPVTRPQRPQIRAIEQ